MGQAAGGELSSLHPTTIPLHGFSDDVLVPGSAGTVRISRLVSVGAYGLVYRGRWGGRDVAVKLMRTPAPGESLTPREVLASFRHEAQLLKRLAHANVVAAAHTQDVAPVCIVQVWLEWRARQLDVAILYRPGHFAPVCLCTRLDQLIRIPIGYLSIM
jgi:serine/threonine protein kinase